MRMKMGGGSILSDFDIYLQISYALNLGYLMLEHYLKTCYIINCKNKKKTFWRRMFLSNRQILMEEKNN